jgi:hypothetical protein
MSKTVRMNMIGAVIVGSIAAMPFAAAAAQKAPTAPKLGRPLTTDELFQLYQGRTWIWKDGAGYFSPKQRQFTSWTGEGDSASYGEGKWLLTDAGKLCFRATWTSKSGNASALTCFSHRMSGSAVYQKREPNGDWYLFKHESVQATDEYAKVRPGDYVSDRFDKLKAQLATKS